jgi:hypothetical protein
LAGRGHGISGCFGVTTDCPPLSILLRNNSPISYYSFCRAAQEYCWFVLKKHIV